MEQDNTKPAVAPLEKVLGILQSYSSQIEEQSLKLKGSVASLEANLLKAREHTIRLQGQKDLIESLRKEYGN